MKDQVVIKQVPITRQGELRTFQVKLPKNATSITGIETGIVAMKFSDREFAALKAYVPVPAAQPVKQAEVLASPLPDAAGNLFTSGLTFRGELLIGELKLQSLEEANIFFAKDVYESDLNFSFGDFSTLPDFFPVAWTHGRNRYEEEVKVNGDTTILQGIFKDRVGERIRRDFPYTVNVYVWYEIKDESHDSRPCA